MTDRPDDPDATSDPFADAPDRWAEADAAWQRKWSEDDPEAAADPPLPPPDADYQPVRPSAESVSDAYGDGMRAAGPHLGLGLQIGGSMALFVGLGVLADRWLDTSPWGVIVGAVLGMIGIVALVVRLSNEANAAKKR